MFGDDEDAGAAFGALGEAEVVGPVVVEEVVVVGLVEDPPGIGFR